MCQIELTRKTSMKLPPYNITHSASLLALQGVHQLSWLPCRFTDERIFLNNLGHTETEFIYREAMLQFGQKGDPPVNPRVITFLITGKP